jgi:hypothetical protein
MRSRVIGLAFAAFWQPIKPSGQIVIGVRGGSVWFGFSIDFCLKSGSQANRCLGNELERSRDGNRHIVPGTRLERRALRG